eukprot:12047.XXX_730849_729949_1 [CDS] Oithona nana genome sequencing.
MDRNTSILWVALLLQLFLSVSSSQSTESSSTLPPTNSQAGRCSRTLHQSFDPLMNNLIANIKSELANFQQSQASQGPQVMITDQHEMATLVAEKLYVKIKDDLITSGNGIISEEVAGMKERIDVIEENKVSNNDRFDSIEETLENKQNQIYFSAYANEGGDVTGDLKFPKIVTNLGGAFDGSSGVFTAPVKGVYTFTFSGQQSSSARSGGAIDLSVRKNGASVFLIYDDKNSSGESQMYQNINSIFSLELNQNDKV